MKTQAILKQSKRIAAYCEIIESNLKRIGAYKRAARDYATMGLREYYLDRVKRSERLSVYLQIRLREAIDQLNKLV